MKKRILFVVMTLSPFAIVLLAIGISRYFNFTQGEDAAMIFPVLVAIVCAELGILYEGGWLNC